MHEHLKSAERHFSCTFQNIREAAIETVDRIEEATGHLKTTLGTRADYPVGLDVAVFGSIARDEMTPRSDFDYLVIAHKTVPDPALFRDYRTAVEGAHEAMGIEPPGSSGLFGAVVSSNELVNNIGLESDTNLTHSRRILVLQESRSLLHPVERHHGLVHAILERYLHDYVDHDVRVPRFLLNDVQRYWRTVAVDYQAKRWDELRGHKWGLRYLKLRSSRKLTYASSLVAVFGSALRGEPLTSLSLQQEYDVPPLARLAGLLPIVAGTSGERPLRDVLVIADEFLGLLADARWRDGMAGVDDPHGDDAPAAFVSAQQRTADLHSSLIDLFRCDASVDHPLGTINALFAHYLEF